MPSYINSGRTILGPDDAWVTYQADFVADHEALKAELLIELAPYLKVPSMKMYGQTILMPRAVSWHGAGDYTYSGQTHQAIAFDQTPALKALLDQVVAHTGTGYNSCLANHYRGGDDSVSWHSDDEPELGPDGPDDVRIASISLGASRRFVLRTVTKPYKSYETYLGAGDLLVMGGSTQVHYRHSVPKTRYTVGDRLNLTFRVRSPSWL